MAKWDLSKLPEGRKPLPDEWFAERAQMQERIKGLEELLWAAENDANEAEAYAGELEAKLAKAVEALSGIEGWTNNPRIEEFVHNAIEELAGGKDE